MVPVPGEKHERPQVLRTILRPFAWCPPGEVRALLVILGVTLLLRLPGLSWLPSPNGDEANWAVYAARAASNRGLEFEAHHRANSPAPAYLLATIMRVAGPSFFWLRLSGVLAVVLGSLFCYLLLARAGAGRVGLGLAAVFAIHPWSVMWSRTVAVPYAIAMAGMTVALVAFWVGLKNREAWWVAVGIVVTAATAHFSPLAVLVTPVCLVLALGRGNRWIFRHPLVLGAGVAAVLAAVPLYLLLQTTAISPIVDAPLTLGDGLRQLGKMTLSGVAGESTVRHFTNVAVGVERAALLGAALVVPLVVLVALPSVRRVVPEARLALLMLASGVFLLPVVLAPGRQWHMPYIDAERYAFVLLPGLGLCLGVLLQWGGRWGRRAAVLGFAAVFLGVMGAASGRVLERLVLGSGMYKGAGPNGECYWGWLTTQDKEGPAFTIAREATRVGAATVLYDGYPLRILDFALLNRPTEAILFDDDHRWKARAGRFLLAYWTDVSQPNAVKRTAEFRLLMYKDFRNFRLERIIHQPDGTPFLELWSAER